MQVHVGRRICRGRVDKVVSRGEYKSNTLQVAIADAVTTVLKEVITS